jgi:hypothetical protein
LLSRLLCINPQWKLIAFIMSIIVGLCVTSSFHVVAASMPRRSAFIVGIITELYVVYLLNCSSKHAWLRTTNNYINVVNASLFHDKYSIDLEKCEIQSPAQQKERGRHMWSFNRIKKVLHLVTWLIHLSREQI